MTRVRFFEGQLLTARDLEAEQTYQMEKRRLHNRMLHGVGVVDGLAVSVEDLPSAPAIVSPGLALDSRILGSDTLLAMDRGARRDH